MRKIGRIITLLLCCMAFVICFVACNHTSGEAQTGVTFIYNYPDAPAAVSINVNEEGMVEEPEEPTREGYIFRGWYTDIAGINKFNFDTVVTENLRLFAKWQMTVATITFDDRIGNKTVVKVDVGDYVVCPEVDPTREDYRFDGWYEDARGARPFDFSKPVESDMTIYAKWVQTVATITFDTRDGNVSTTTKVEIGETLQRPTVNPTREDYAFTDWYADAQLTILYDFSTPVTGNLTLYAGWDLTVATVTLNANFEGAQNSIVKVPIGEKLKAEAPARTGYDFNGWYLDAACTHVFDVQAEIDNHLVLYAGWEVQTYTVTFNYNGNGQNVTTQSVTYGDLVEEPENDPTRTGYRFIGWYTDSAATNEFKFDETLISSDIILYAGWASESGATDECIVTFMSNGTVYTTQTYQQGKRFSAPAAPDRGEKYYFSGWVTEEGGTEIFSGRVNNSMTLYARWLTRYTFEAEYTNLNGKPGQGLSDNCSGTQLIVDANKEMENADEL